jgi:cation diffusion facilitator CzcD-associated flavoprotein CzcO
MMPDARSDRSHLSAILGAGPAGLAQAPALKEQALPYEQLEAADDVGGNSDPGVDETGHIISSRLMMPLLSRPEDRLRKRSKKDSSANRWPAQSDSNLQVY